MFTAANIRFQEQLAAQLIRNVSCRQIIAAVVRNTVDKAASGTGGKLFRPTPTLAPPSPVFFDSEEEEEEEDLPDSPIFTKNTPNRPLNGRSGFPVASAFSGVCHFPF